MSTEAKNLVPLTHAEHAEQAESSDKSQKSDSPIDPQLDDFVRVCAAVLSADTFDSYQKISTDSRRLELFNANAKLILTSLSGLDDFLSQIKGNSPAPNNLNELVIVFLEKGELEPKGDLRAKTSRFIVFVWLPLTLRQLLNQLKSYIQMQQHFAKSTKHSELISDGDHDESIKYVLRVSRELNGIRDTNKLLSLILAKAREICNADAGSIYVVEWENYEKQKGDIHFKITQNESVQLDLQEFKIPINDNSIVGNAVIHEESINIPDLYKLNPDRTQNPFKAQHDRSWDNRIGYQCRSMLTLPMFDISNRVIGVIQLINKKTVGTTSLNPDLFETNVIPFDSDTVEVAEIVAHQAGIALENALLTEERERLFEGFVHASVTAIEQRDPTTSGHSHRVAVLTLETAKIVSNLAVGPYKDVTFSEGQLKEVEYASLLHDFGKLGVREEVLVKAKKLYPMERRLVLERFDHARTAAVLEYLQELVAFNQNPEKFPPGTSSVFLEAAHRERIAEIDEYLSFVLKCNEPTVLEQGGFEKLKDLANSWYKNSRQVKKQLLLDDELKALSVSRGSLTREEFAEIQSHVTHTYEFLRKIPWGNTFSNVPQIAAKHHEKLDGSGYPTGAYKEEIPVQSRIMTIADIFDALTAADRPYKKSVPALRALEIIEMEVKAGKVDVELFNIFVESKVYNSVQGV